ncbi:hypothetical protein SDC9_109896 [bioreactor metagenome]|uniref:Uncharacterized protein n=1 Tax=bioreactor metagenome TaxID=1076179 RepID=A0A645BD88_9ZZZZ
MQYRFLIIRPYKLDVRVQPFDTEEARRDTLFIIAFWRIDALGEKDPQYTLAFCRFAKDELEVLLPNLIGGYQSINAVLDGFRRRRQREVQISRGPEKTLQMILQKYRNPILDTDDFIYRSTFKFRIFSAVLIFDEVIVQ